MAEPLKYIKDKDMYKAVCFACKMIRENGYFNKAIDIASNYYEVSPQQLEKYVRQRQGIGQKKANKKNPRKYHYYEVSMYEDIPFWSEYDNDCSFGKGCKRCKKIVKATSPENARKQIEWNYETARKTGSLTWIVDEIIEIDKKK